MICHEETRKKMSESSKRRQSSTEYRRIRSESTKTRISKLSL